MANLVGIIVGVVVAVVVIAIAAYFVNSKKQDSPEQDGRAKQPSSKPNGTTPPVSSTRDSDRLPHYHLKPTTTRDALPTKRQPRPVSSAMERTYKTAVSRPSETTTVPSTSQNTTKTSKYAIRTGDNYMPSVKDQVQSVIGMVETEKPSRKADP